MPVCEVDQRMKRRVRATLVVILGVQTFLAAFLAGVGRVGAVKVWLVMVVCLIYIYSTTFWVPCVKVCATSKSG